MSKFIYTFGILALLVPSISLANDAFSWKDEEGRLHFGTKPPPQAAEVKKIVGKTFSRYSSAKLLTPLNNFNSSGITKIEEKNLVKNQLGKADNREVKNQARASLKEKDELKTIQLEKSPLDIKFNDSKQVTSCSITLKNTSAIPASGILVTFEFEDGTLIPATGPDNIAAESVATYSITDDVLPITIKGFNSSSEKNPAPKVDVKTAN